MPPILTIAVSTRALFHLEKENAVFDADGMAAYRAYQREHEDVVLAPGPAFPLVSKLLKFSLCDGAPAVEVIVVSRNSPDLALRFSRSIEHHRLNITRSAFTSGQRVPDLLPALGAGMFLSLHDDDVRQALAAGVAAAKLCVVGDRVMSTPDDTVHVSFDGDAVLFGGESESVFKAHGLQVFRDRERALAAIPMSEGPFLPVLRSLARLQKLETSCGVRVVTSLVTARNAPAHERAIRTLRSWDIAVDQAYFLGGRPKTPVLSAIRPDLFLDDQFFWCADAAKVVTAGHVIVDYPPAPPDAATS